MAEVWDVERMVDDLGGPALLMERIGGPRTAPYRWIRTGNITLNTLTRIQNAYPDFDFNDYWTDGLDERGGK